MPVRYIDEKVARTLQDKYLQGESRGLSALYVELRRMAVLILEDMKVSQDKIDEYSHDAASAVCAMYIKKPGWQINKSIRQYMKTSCERASQERELNPSGGHKERAITRARAAEVPIEINGNLHGNVKVDDSLIATLPCATYLFQDDGKIDDPYLLGILKGYFVKFKRYSLAVKQLEVFVERRWIYDHARHLHEIWLETRNGKGGENGFVK